MIVDCRLSIVDCRLSNGARLGWTQSRSLSKNGGEPRWQIKLLMHELPVTKSILGIVLRHAESNGVQKVVSIQLSIGALSDLEEEWLQSYFDHLSRGTVAEGAKLQVRRSNLTFFCRQCSLEFSVPREDLDNTQCPECGGNDATLVSGTGYSVESMEAQ